ncbi:uncharacterized protein PV09_01707 [Verruconis gallopava]|uniref:N-acetyltransferase domain-containing protein n=1 Tax=Verruconis gallopava TaxID=253628 RepID=A0A0D1XY86_9PEZI|nr:uncharacterized protein PV09_01707 [Verruconis gallopava]KIW07781.1 hypothetical protein PV09_01707 [Verruconis gallopava]
MTAVTVHLREATVDDIPAMLSMLLTSFRRFPLFDYLYAPLHDDVSNASDTLYFWDKRLRKTLWDPSRTIIVAEGRNCGLPSEPREAPTQQIERESWSMLSWINSSQALPLSSSQTVCTPIGFAVWQWKGMVQANGGTGHHYRSSLEHFQELLVDLQLWYWRLFYHRKDQDATRFMNYLRSEEDLEKRYHNGTFLYLDNICVDFRVAGNGVGKRLLEWGIQKADSLEIPIKTETTDNNVKFYENSGFKSIGQWTVKGFHQATGMKLHVMQRGMHLE